MPAMTRRTTPVPVRLARILRLVAHVVRGLWVVHTRYASLPPGRQDEELRRWGRELLAKYHPGITVPAASDPDDDLPRGNAKRGQVYLVILFLIVVLIIYSAF